MEYTALLAGQRFNDHPHCTHRALAELARQINDRVTASPRSSLITRAPALAAIGSDQAGVAAAVADAIIDALWQYAPNSVLLLWRTHRRPQLHERDTPGRSRWGRKRDLMVIYNLIYGGLCRLERTTRDPAVKDRILLEVLDRALTNCADRSPQPPRTLSSVASCQSTQHGRVSPLVSTRSGLQRSRRRAAASHFT